MYRLLLYLGLYAALCEHAYKRLWVLCYIINNTINKKLTFSSRNNDEYW